MSEKKEKQPKNIRVNELMDHVPADIIYKLLTGYYECHENGSIGGEENAEYCFGLGWTVATLRPKLDKRDFDSAEDKLASPLRKLIQLIEPIVKAKIVKDNPGREEYHIPGDVIGEYYREHVKEVAQLYRDKQQQQLAAVKSTV